MQVYLRESNINEQIKYIIPSSKPEAEAKELLFRSKIHCQIKTLLLQPTRKTICHSHKSREKCHKVYEKEIEMGYTKGNNLNFVKTQVLALTKTGRQA
jgi:hypothetical protein